MKVRRLAAIWSAKLVTFLCKVTGKMGETLPGKIALRIYPDILKDLSSEVREKIFVVCGTNGKTTTNNLLCAAVQSEGKKVVCNKTGSNMLNGVVSAFVCFAGLNGKLDADYACIEIDEASTVRVFPYFQPDYMVITNLFRDQLDRYGEIDITMKVLAKAIDMAPDVELIVNGDDSLSTSLAVKSGHAFKTFGVSEKVFKEEDENPAEIREGSFCPICGTKLDYEYFHYSQLGNYDCPGCSFARPAIDFPATGVNLKNGLSFQVLEKKIDINYRGFYNIYNILAAYAAAKTGHLSMQHFDQILSDYNPQNGRMEQFRIGENQIMLNLAKNPAGFNQNISAVMEDETPKDVIIVINDNAQDGTDVSWLWDVDFERLKDTNARKILVSGIRGRDMLIRLKYVDIQAGYRKTVEEAIRELLKDGTGNLYVLVNYTALYDTHILLKKMEKEQG